jgi:hypothetical protein
LLSGSETGRDKQTCPAWKMTASCCHDGSGVERLAEALDVPLGHLLVRSGWAGANDDLGAETLTNAGVMDGHVNTDGVEAPAPTVRETLAQIRALVDQVESLMEDISGDDSIPGTSLTGET